MRILIVDAENEASFERPDLRLEATWNVVRSSSIAQLESDISSANPPIELVIVYQDRPKQLSQSIVTRCLAARPLTRIVQVLGPWCDGDLRTPGRIAGVFPISFRDAHHRLAEWIDQFRTGAGPLVRPLTAPETAGGPIAKSRPLKVGVRLPGHLAAGAAASLQALGHSVAEDSDSDQIDLLLIDGDAEPQTESTLPTLSLHGFSRSSSHKSLAKTYSLAELDAALRSVTASAATPKLPISR